MAVTNRTHKHNRSIMKIGIPASNRTVDVRIVDTTLRLSNGPLAHFMGPAIKGHDGLTAGAFAFLITHKDPDSGLERNVLFDLGPPKNWKTDLPEPFARLVSGWEDNGCIISIEKYVSEVLVENGVQLEDIESLIWSHAHWDHTGRPSLFPPSVKLIVGPGILEAFGPGYPENQAAPFTSSELAGRPVTELSFAPSQITIGGLKAIDFFADGSFYLLDAPGHAVGHINALARTTSSPDTFIFLGADSYHLGAQLRPNEHTPLPDVIEIEGFSPCPCPGDLLTRIHPALPAGENAARTTPFYSIPEKSVAVDSARAQDVVCKIQAFDADEDILVLNAHEWNYYDVLELFPRRANGWKEKGWKDRARWRFLRELQGAVDLVRDEE
ncbi:Cytochrome P450 monooxygenase andK [Drechslerella dactyloides]|uniref:Cytochrome P450 monooxygenase andK n=1 Tax=Drechslerella dactyloides TaxID=74499 RepID=A0AAD6IRQ5_DREDA|nr:Cytochrome P450 monooxygenase andK [Drechslerella dactyloides]